MQITDSVKTLPLIGDVKAKQLERLNIETIKDLLFHIPFKYRDTSNIISIEKFKEEREGTILAQVEKISNAFTRTRKVVTKAKVTDESGSINIIWFNQMYLTRAIHPGEYFLFEGKIPDKIGAREMVAPSFEKFQGDISEQKHIGKITPYYPETANVTSKWLRGRISILKKTMTEMIPDSLPEDTRRSLNLLPLGNAIYKVHFPESFNDIDEGRERLSFDEMLKVALKIEKKVTERNKRNAIPIKGFEDKIEAFIKSLPYSLTKDQQTSTSQIISDISKDIPMNRLLNGDVGSGKTVVAAIAMYITYLNGMTSIIMAPTTILASQHFDTLSEIFKKVKVPIELNVSGRKIKEERNAKIIVGTHAILYDENLPNNVGLVIVDEQHRFGVIQREKLITKKNDGTYPHFLMMTATPIPHTLTNVIFGDMEVSFIRELPPHRIPIKSHFVPYEKRISCYNWIDESIKKSKGVNQAFIVFPLIEESEKIDAKAAVSEYESLSKGVFSDLRVALLHGQMKGSEKDRILNEFKQKKYNVLVSTSVIEVGIDIPDASIMVIESAERFGLAQLHQFRGRVGRGNLQSYCYVIGGENTPVASKNRLKYFATHSNGFDVAEYDLEKRGPGEVYGLKQSGIPSFKVASITDLSLLIKARRVAQDVLEKNINVLENLFE